MTKLLKHCKFVFMAKINVDKGKCIGCGLCVSINADCFKMSDDGKAEVIVKEQCGCGCNCEDKTAKEAVESCPVKAITIK